MVTPVPEPTPKPLTKLRDFVDAGQTACHVQPPRYPGFFSMTFLVKQFLGFYWLQIILEHPSALNHTSTIAGFPSWDILLEHLTDKRANDLEWNLVAGDPLQLPTTLTEFLYYDQEKKEKWAAYLKQPWSPPDQGDQLDVIRRRLEVKPIEGEPGDQAPDDQGEA